MALTTENIQTILMALARARRHAAGDRYQVSEGY